MKSLLISSIYFPPQVGGISSYMSSILSVLGPDRVCCLTGVSENHCSNHGKLGVRVYRRPSAFAKSTYVQALGWGAAVTQIMVRERPQAVQLATVGEGYLGLWLKRWFNIPFVVYAYGNEILGAMQNDWPKPRLALQRADRVLAISHFTADLVQKAGVAPDRIEIVHPGCDVGRFQPLHPRTNLRQKLLGGRYKDKVILTVGNLVARKGHDMVIRALPRLRQTIPNVTYLVVGDGPYSTQLETLAVGIGVRDRVIFAGKVPEEDLPDIYALSDVFVMPSREQLDVCDAEGFGIVFLEANACGKPVVGGRSGGIPDAIMDEVTGLLVNPHDPTDIANALTRLLTDRHFAHRLGQQGRLRAVRDFNWEKVCGQVQAILESTVRDRPV